MTTFTGIWARAALVAALTAVVACGAPAAWAQGTSAGPTVGAQSSAPAAQAPAVPATGHAVAAPARAVSSAEPAAAGSAPTAAAPGPQEASVFGHIGGGFLLGLGLLVLWLLMRGFTGGGGG